MAESGPKPVPKGGGAAAAAGREAEDNGDVPTFLTGTNSEEKRQEEETDPSTALTVVGDGSTNMQLVAQKTTVDNLFPSLDLYSDHPLFV